MIEAAPDAARARVALLLRDGPAAPAQFVELNSSATKPLPGRLQASLSAAEALSIVN